MVEALFASNTDHSLEPGLITIQSQQFPPEHLLDDSVLGGVARTEV